MPRYLPNFSIRICIRLVLAISLTAPVFAEGEDLWIIETAARLQARSQALRQETKQTAAALAENFEYAKVLRPPALPGFLYELGFANGRTLSPISADDQRGDVVDTSLNAGLGLPLPIVPARSGQFDAVALLNISFYSGAGNGTAISPLLNVSYTTPQLLSTLALYTGLGAGLGYDSMDLPGYTNTTKWTLDLFAGLQYTFVQNFYLRFGPLLRHKSHSFVGPWESQGSNIGYNGLMLQVTMRALNP